MTKYLFALLLAVASSAVMAKSTFSSNAVWGNNTYGQLDTGDIVYQDDEIICLHGKSNKCYDKEVLAKCGMPPKALEEKMKYQDCKKSLAAQTSNQ